MSKAPLAGEQTGANPTDRGKKGTKRHVLTKAHGLPIELTVTGANVHDKTQVEAVLETMPLLPPFPEVFCRYATEQYRLAIGQQTKKGCTSEVSLPGEQI